MRKIVSLAVAVFTLATLSACGTPVKPEIERPNIAFSLVRFAPPAPGVKFSGQTAFRVADEVRAELAAQGWREVATTPLNVAKILGCDMDAALNGRVPEEVCRTSLFSPVMGRGLVEFATPTAMLNLDGHWLAVVPDTVGTADVIAMKDQMVLVVRQ